MPLPPQDLRVALRRCPSYDEATVAAAITALAEDLAGGWRAIIPAGARVLLKPNLLKPATPEQVVCPHPSVIKAVAQACRDAGAGSVRIGDSPGLASARRVAEKSGIAYVAQELGIEVIEFEDSQPITTPVGFSHRSLTVATEVLQSDVIINIAKCKTHAMMGLTLSVKNLYGVFVGKQKARWHFQCGSSYSHFARLLVELAYTIQPAFSIVDAVVAMEGNGPGNGTPRQLGFLAASRDMLSLDRIVADLVGFTPEQVPIFAAACDVGFDTVRDHIMVIGDRPEEVSVRDFQPAARMHVEGPLPVRLLGACVRRWLTTRPLIHRDRCKSCGLCMQVCPAHCISIPHPGEPAALATPRCIRCFCCQEICPEGAITVHDGLGVRLLKRFRLE